MNNYKKMYEENLATEEKTLSELTEHLEKQLKKYRYSELKHEREICHALETFIYDQKRLLLDLELNTIANVQMVLRKRDSSRADGDCLQIDRFMTFSNDRTIDVILEKHRNSFLEIREMLSDCGVKETEHYKEISNPLRNLN